MGAVNGERGAVGDGAHQLALRRQPLIRTIKAQQNHSDYVAVILQRHAPQCFCLVAPRRIQVRILISGIERKSGLPALRDRAGKPLSWQYSDIFLNLAFETDRSFHMQHFGIKFAQQHHAHARVEDGGGNAQHALQ